MGCSSCPPPCSGAATIPGSTEGDGGHPHAEREQGSSGVKQFPKSQSGVCGVPGSCSPPGFPPPIAQRVPCGVTPLVAASQHSGGPPVWASPALERRSEAAVTPSPLAAQLPLLPKLTTHEV